MKSIKLLNEFQIRLYPQKAALKSMPSRETGTVIATSPPPPSDFNPSVEVIKNYCMTLSHRKKVGHYAVGTRVPRLTIPQKGNGGYVPILYKSPTLQPFSKIHQKPHPPREII